MSVNADQLLFIETENRKNTKEPFGYEKKLSQILMKFKTLNPNVLGISDMKFVQNWRQSLFSNLQGQDFLALISLKFYVRDPEA